MNDYNVHICIKSELKDLQQFINDHWRKNHILATSQKLMDWQHYNKENEKRRALSSFFVICASHDIIDKSAMETIIVNFIHKIYELIDLENKQNTIEEIVTNINVMLKGGKFLKNLKQYPFIKKTIKKFAESMDYKQH